MANLDVQVTRLEALCQSFTEKIADLKSSAGDLDRTLRGHNGDPGLLTRMSGVETQLQSLSPSIQRLTEEVQELRLQTALPHTCFQAETIAELTRTVQQLADQVERMEKGPAPEKPGDSDKVTWTWIREKTLQPVLILLISYIFFQLLPKLLVLLGQHSIP